MKPWLIEINQSPSFHTDSKLDESVKQKLLEDTFKILNMTSERKKVYLQSNQKDYYERLMIPYTKAKLTPEEKDQKRMELDKQRTLDEMPILNEENGYKQIYPIVDDEQKAKKYKRFLKMAKDLQNEFIHGKAKVKFEDKEFDLLINGKYAEQQILGNNNAKSKTRPLTSYKRVAG